jgi:hypothetical protein
VSVGVSPQRGNPLSDSCIKFLRESQPPCMEVRNDPPEYRVTSITCRYVYAFFLRCNPQHAWCGDGRQYAGPVTVSFTQPDAPDVTSARSSSLRSVRRLGSFSFGALAFRVDFTLRIAETEIST